MNYILKCILIIYFFLFIEIVNGSVDFDLFDSITLLVGNLIGEGINLSKGDKINIFEQNLHLLSINIRESSRTALDDLFNN
jgi:hypothetical protein